jgi:hypothetical protein
VKVVHTNGTLVSGRLSVFPLASSELRGCRLPKFSPIRVKLFFITGWHNAKMVDCGGHANGMNGYGTVVGTDEGPGS